MPPVITYPPTPPRQPRKQSPPRNFHPPGATAGQESILKSSLKQDRNTSRSRF